MQTQSRDSFPSDTKKNPKGCMEITLKSGRELQKRKDDDMRMAEKEKKVEIKKKTSCTVQK